ncbi:MAG: ABC transporter ATP-binding protein [Ruminococcaceae bacterium]|nr:ABC transporter ATP-binding protein [Oscillospiraceae bacterium]
MKTMLKYLIPLKKRMTVGFIIKCSGTMIELLIPYILTHILRNVVATENIYKVLFWGTLMLVCATSACICNVVANRMAAKVSKIFSERMRKDLFEKTMKLSARQTDRFSIPSLESRITTDTYNVHNFIGTMQRMGVRAPILLLGGIIITMIMDSFLSLVMIAILPFIFVTVFTISKKGVPLYTGVQKSVDSMVRVVREDTQGIRVIKALSKNNYENRRYDKVNLKLSKDERYAGTIMGIVNPIMTMLMNFGITAVVAVSALRVSKNLSSPETVIAFMQYFTLISMAMMSVSRMFVMYTKCAASASRIAEVLNTPVDLDVIESTNETTLNTDAHIVFKDVCFSYLGKTNQLENISFSLKKGGSLGVIGATGCGKSTIIKLLMRFYDTTSGQIFINGRDIRTIPKEELTNMFGVCLQNDFLYADTIEENIIFGRDLSHDDVVKAAKIAQADDFISSFPDGYDHLLSPKATNISGGQKQRILISRAIAARPDILILDDSSSALDYKTDANLRIALKENMTDSTIVTVAQRVSSIKDCDIIIVLDNGKIIGFGKHEYLLENCTEYKEISDSQMGGALLD